MLALITCMALMWLTYGSKDIRFLSANFQRKDNNYGNARIDFVTNLGPNYHVRLQIAVPCKDKKQYSDITKKTANIKNAFITTIDRNEFAELIARRDFDTIKKTYISIINRFADKPIDAIFFESFNY